MRMGVIAVLSWALVVGLSAQKNVAEVQHSTRAYHLAPLVIAAATDRVAVDVVVRQPNGAVVAGLPQSDFRVYDDGQERRLSGFVVVRGGAAATAPAVAAEGARPGAAAAAGGRARSVVLFFDDVNTGKGDLEHARNAAERFVSEALEPRDRVAIFTASGKQSLNFTHNKAKLLAAIGKLTTHPRHERRFGMCPHITPFQAYQIIRLQGGMALTAAIAEKQACDKQQGIENNDGTEAYTGNNGIPGFDNQSFQIMA
ncbi:MAG: VWA domain-containing protein, partial [Terriglobales bacterium]